MVGGHRKPRKEQLKLCQPSWTLLWGGCRPTCSQASLLSQKLLLI